MDLLIKFSAEDFLHITGLTKYKRQSHYTDSALFLILELLYFNNVILRMDVFPFTFIRYKYIPLGNPAALKVT